MNLDWIFGIAGALADEIPSDGPTPTPTIDPNAGAGAGDILGLLMSFFPLILMGVVFYFFLIRPQRKKDKKVKEMLAALKPGDRVTTIGGIYGTIVSVKDETITLSIGAQRTEMVVTRWAIRQVEEVSVENDGEILA